MYILLDVKVHLTGLELKESYNKYNISDIKYY